MRLIDLLPNFTVELQQSCETLGRPDLAAQLGSVELDSSSFNYRTQVACLRLRHKGDPEPLEPVHTAAVAPPNEKVQLRHRYGVYAETDNAGRMRTVVLLRGDEITAALAKFSTLRQ